MKTRIEGLVQLKTGDAVKGVICDQWFSRFIRVDNASALSAADPASGQVKVDGIVWIPRANVSFIQEIIKAEAA